MQTTASALTELDRGQAGQLHALDGNDRFTARQLVESTAKHRHACGPGGKPDRRPAGRLSEIIDLDTTACHVTDDLASQSPKDGTDFTVCRGTPAGPGEVRPGPRSMHGDGRHSTLACVLPCVDGDDADLVGGAASKARQRHTGRGDPAHQPVEAAWRPQVDAVA